MKPSILFVLIAGLAVGLNAQTPSPKTALLSPNRQRYEHQKYGLFVHYVPELTVDARGRKPDIDSLAKSLDTAQFAKDASDFGVGYVIFTVWHLRTCTLYPSAVNKKWRSDRRAPGGTDPRNTKTFADTDLIDRLAGDLEKKGIDLHLYVHPADGHDLSTEDQDLTGWSDKDHTKWNDYQCELFGELLKRYGSRIKGLWFDGYFHNIDQPRLRAAIESSCPGLALVGNAADARKRNLFRGIWPAVDYFSWECGGPVGIYGLSSVNPAIRGDDAVTWPGTKEQVAMIVSGGSWWAANPTAKAKVSVENLYKYLVLQASASRGGGLAVAAGVLPGSARDYPTGTIWEGNFRETMVALNKLVAPVAKSIQNTAAGKAYETPERIRLNQMDWGVCTESPDGKSVYLHILRPPSGKKLVIAETEDGSKLGGEAIDLRTKTPVQFKRLDFGYEIALPEGSSWSALDTVIEVRRL